MVPWATAGLSFCSPGSSSAHIQPHSKEPKPQGQQGWLGCVWAGNCPQLSPSATGAGTASPAQGEAGHPWDGCDLQGKALPPNPSQVPEAVASAEF